MVRVFVDSEGRRWIVDCKTSSHEGADLDAFRDRGRTSASALGVIYFNSDFGEMK